MNSVLEILEERGYLAQITHREEIEELLSKEKISFYIGFDPTADSLHVGHFLGMMVMAHMQQAGHKPIRLIGGGTATIGDPSGKTDMRKMLTPEQIEHNCDCFKKQMAKFIDFSDDKAIMLNNAQWLKELNYIELLQEVGAHFSVNRMLTAECYKQRMEKGLTFLEFNYMIMQAYDFWKLHKDFDCKMELGGDDQWSNIIAGVELVRRKESKPVFGLTFTLLTTSDGRKMGKTEKGALWLDATKTSPYEFYQYWRNIDDADVEKCLALLTFLPMAEVRRLGALQDKEINIEIKRIYNRRSLDANAYFHFLVNKLARYFNISDEEMKIKMNLQYGTIAKDNNGNSIGVKIPITANIKNFYKYAKDYLNTLDYRKRIYEENECCGI